MKTPVFDSIKNRVLAFKWRSALCATGVNLNRILIIGNGNSIFVKDFIHRYAVRGVLVDLVSLTHCERLPEVDTQINCSMEKPSRLGSAGRFIDMTRQIRRSMQNLPGTYDCIVIHYINFILFPHVFCFKQKAKRVVAIMYGSDYYQSTWVRDRLKYPIYRACDGIAFTNPRTRDDFQLRHTQFARKLHVVRFGLPVLDEIDNLKTLGSARQEMCRRFSLPHEKVIVLVGYSASKSHRQAQIIKSLSSLSEEIKDRVHLVFPLGYGEADIEESILRELKSAGIASYSILKEFYGFSDAAKLRCVTDILVNVQPSDQFSGSMQETLYAGGNVIAGAWLPYQELISAGCSIISVEVPEDVGRVLGELVISGKALASAAPEGVRRYIGDASSWRANLAKWDEVLFPGDSYGVGAT